MIDQPTLKRDAQANIADYPVTLRHYYNATQYDTVTAGLNALNDSDLLQPAGLLDQPSLDIIAIVDDFINGLPRNRDRVDVLIGPAWIPFEVKRVPDYYDPLGPTIQFNLGTPDA